MGAFKEPHGGELKNLYLDDAGVKAEKARARDLPSWDLNMRQVCDIEMLLNGAFSPLEGFLDEKDYQSVLSNMRLASGVIWPMPINLDVKPDFSDKLKVGDEIALRDGEGVLIATMKISSIYRPDKALEAKSVFGTNDARASRRELSHAAQPRRLPRRQASRRRGAEPLRLQAPARHAEGDARPLPEARLAQGRRVPDAQPDASRAPGADVPRCEGRRGEPADPAGRRHDEARRRRPLHARALLRASGQGLSRADDRR